MSTLFIECFSGLSGDMFLAAMIDMGVPADYLSNELSKLHINEEFHLDIKQADKMGIFGTQVHVHLHEHQHGHTHDHHDHGHTHEHDHGHHHKHEHHHHHEHRNLHSISHIINDSSLSDEVKKTSMEIFTLIAKAEAKIHAKSIDEVHFHEVGATDSIVDIVGAAICLHYLQPEKIVATPIELGGGFVKCAHGLMPVPAPATAEILHGLPTTRGKVQFETTTPTGAAILATIVDEYSTSFSAPTEKTAYGIGHRDMEIPNLVRMSWAKTNASVQAHRLLQCNIDDMSAETIAPVIDLLLESGAQDAHFTPIVMKKGRPALTLSVLCNQTQEEALKMLLFTHTTTLGIKSIVVDKTELQRTFETIETTYGKVNVKHAFFNGQLVNSKPEMEDCKRLAEAHQIPLHQMIDLIKVAILQNSEVS
ncbi:nickel pincer cofactor biosynthesis protein LarC [Prolixibacteraceae bacterium JC049]|nr:nickel pincer cofactor biosynthesis protein LarC [Prolixibacteraceae bacterium JC049]